LSHSIEMIAIQEIYSAITLSLYPSFCLLLGIIESH